MENNNIILHIGLAKCASTYLQKKIFPYLEDVYLDWEVIHLDRQNAGKAPLPLASLYPDKEIIKDDFYNNFKRYLVKKDEILKYAKSLNHSKIILSNENYTTPNIEHYSNYSLILKDIFPKAKIIFIVRNQPDWAESFYKQIMCYIKNHLYTYGGVISINDYYNYTNGKFQSKNSTSPQNISWKKAVNYNMDVNEFNWYQISKYYIDLFGEKNVLILPYELLKENRNLFLSTIYNFMEVEHYYPENNQTVNVTGAKESLFRYNPLLSKYGKFIVDLPENKFKKIILKNDRSFRKFLIKYFDSKIDISKEKFTVFQKEQIIDIHKDSNKKLSEIIGMDLSQYGYY